MKKRHYLIRHQHLFVSITLFFSVVTGLLPFVIVATYEWSFLNRVYPGVKLSDRRSRLNTASIKLTYEPTGEQQKEFVIQASQLDIQIDWPTTREKLMNVGRTGHFGDDIKTKIEAYRTGISVDPVLSYNRDLLDQTIASIGKSIDVPAIEPKFRLIDGRVIAFQLAIPGKSVNRSLLFDLMVRELFAENPQAAIDIPVVTKEPKTNSEQRTAESMGIRELLGRGVSTYVGSMPERRHNVALTASKINGTLVAPGTVFSFNDTLGEVSQETGFKKAYIISQGRTILGDGGGVCQDSTTLFRAVLNAGLPVVERRAHSYRVSYYEQHSPPGLDATVAAPTTDFTFQNDTPAYVLVQASIDHATSTVSYELWGTSDGRVAKTTKPVVTDITPPPPDLYQDDPSLRSGAVKQVDWKASGAKVIFSYTVTRGGETIHQKTFVSLYHPWQSVFLRGTGAS